MWQRAVSGEVDRRLGESMLGYVEANKLTAESERADKADREAARLRTQAERLQEEVEKLQGQVRDSSCLNCG